MPTLRGFAVHLEPDFY